MMNISLVDISIVLISIVIGISADWKYYLGLDKPGHHQPNRWSWLIWSFSALVEVATFKGISTDWLKVIPLATTPIACFVILNKVWRMRENRWDEALEKVIDITSVALSFIAIMIWVFFSEELWAHIIMICAVPISYVPQWKEMLKTSHFCKGDQLPWLLWTIMDITNLFLILRRLDTVVETPYVIIELVCHASVWLWISFGIRRHMKIQKVNKDHVQV